jgi:hypothetical protein
MNTFNAINIKDCVQTRLSLSATAATPVQFSAGNYSIQSDTDCFVFLRSTSALADDVTTTTGFPLMANNQLTIIIPKDYYVSAITSSAAGTLILHSIGGAA